MRVRGHLGKELELYSKSGDKSAGEMRHTSFTGGSEVKVFLPGESHGRRSLAGYSPRGRKESDTTERLYLHLPLIM